MRVDAGLTRDGRERLALSYDEDTGQCNGVILTPTDPTVMLARQRAAFAVLVTRFGPWLGGLLYRALS